MPGYESKMDTGVKEGDPAMPARFLYQNRQKEREKNDPNAAAGGNGGAGAKSWKNGGRYTPYVRKAIPKRTALVGTAKHECAVLPVFNDEYRRFQMNRTIKEDAPQYTTKFLDDSKIPGNLLTPGTTGTGISFSNFIVSIPPSISSGIIALLTLLPETRATCPQDERQQVVPYRQGRSHFSPI